MRSGETGDFELVVSGVRRRSDSDLADERGSLLRLLGQLRVELLDVHESLSEAQHVLWPVQVLHVHLQRRETRVPHVQLIPHTLSTDTRLYLLMYLVMTVDVSITAEVFCQF